MSYFFAVWRECFFLGSNDGCCIYTLIFIQLVLRPGTHKNLDNLTHGVRLSCTHSTHTHTSHIKGVSMLQTKCVLNSLNPANTGRAKIFIVMFRNQQSDKRAHLTLQACGSENEGWIWTSLSSSPFSSSHYYYHFLCEQTSATPWVPPRKDCPKVCNSLCLAPPSMTAGIRA